MPDIFVHALSCRMLHPPNIMVATSIYYKSFVCTQFNVFKYCYVSLTIQLKHQSFVYTHLNDQTVLLLTIQFCISHLFALSLNVKQFYLIHR